jgi:hypothetical protein
MPETEIKKQASQHILLCLLAICVVRGITMVITRYQLLDASLLHDKACSIAAIFSVFESVILTTLWKWVATKHLNFLATFHTASSGFRMFLVLVTLGVIYAVVGRDEIVPWVIAFMVNYFVLLVLHSIFFAKMVNKLFK